MSDNGVGVQALYSSCVVFGNVISSRLIGVIMVGCPDSSVEANTVTVSPLASVTHSGIMFESCTNLLVSCNVVDSYYYGIGTDSGNAEYPDSEDVTVSWNKISNCVDGGIRACDVKGMTVNANTLQSNGIGIYVDPSASGLLVHHNMFLDNQVQAVEDPLCIGNEWDDGYPSGGNYWSDYLGVDEFSGVDQTEPGPDGIGDTPYLLGSGSQDNYPFMEAPYTSDDDATAAASSSVLIDAETRESALESDASVAWDPETRSNTILRRDWDADGTQDSD
jgi:nitrous oxidase accessory protein NosD